MRLKGYTIAPFDKKMERQDGALGRHFDGKDERTSPIWGKCAENSLGRGHANYLTNYFTVRFRQITDSNSWWFTKKCVLLQTIRGKASPPTASPPAPLRGEGGSLTPDSLTPSPSPGRGEKNRTASLNYEL